MTPIAVAVPLAWLLWLVLTEWVPMYPLNDLRPGNLRDRVLAACVNYPFPLAIAAGVALHRPWSLAVALVLCGLCVLGHVRAWWLPYFGRASAGQAEQYRREYARTLKILPTDGHAVVIDVQHIVVGVLTLAMAATTALAAFL
ncbi:hypothetical protein ACQP00_34900 [Dactylosporangium sp. CS-047395]|uniref:hypothetical protein n=1 Tax=Dactylosporangium sp. CS-047395 TaxID=3239936 RepID=UPI003D91BD6B